MRPRHWQLLMKSTGKQFEMGPQFSLQQLLDLDVRSGFPCLRGVCFFRPGIAE